MRIVSLIDDPAVIERILRHLGLWPALRSSQSEEGQEGVRVHAGADPPRPIVLEPWTDDPFPDYDTEPVMAYAVG